AGLAAGFAGVGSGFTANIIVSNTDAVLSGISAEVMSSLNTTVTVTPVDNYYFMLTSVFLLSIAGALITGKVVEPRLGEYKGNVNKEFEPVKPIEKRALRNAAFAAVAYVGLLLLVLFLPESPLRGEDGSIIPSPFLAGIVPIILCSSKPLVITSGLTKKKLKVHVLSLN